VHRICLIFCALIIVGGGVSTVVAQDDPDDGASVSLEAASGVQPAASSIPKIGVASEIEIIGIVEGFLQQPADPNGVGWYAETSGLGVAGNVVLAGAFRDPNAGVGDPSRLGELQAGDLTELTDADGARYTYAVKTLTEYTEDEVLVDEIVAQTPDEQLTLVANAGSEGTDANGSVTVLRAVRTAAASVPAAAATSTQTAAAAEGSPTDAAVTGEAATPPAADGSVPVASGEVLDLAAMALLPEDVEPEGFGLSAGRFTTAAEVAAVLAETGLGDPNELLDRIEASGFRQQYSVSLSLARDEAAAEAGPAVRFDRNHHRIGLGGGRREFLRLGGESDRGHARNADRRHDRRWLAIQLRSPERNHRRSARVAVPTGRSGVSGRRSGWAAGDDRSDERGYLCRFHGSDRNQFLERIDEVRENGGPGQSGRLLRLTGEGVVRRQDFYTRRGGTSFSLYRDSARETFASGDTETDGRDGRLVDVEDAYVVAEAIAAGRERGSDDVRVVVTLYRFTDESAASAWFEDMNEIARRNRDLLDEPERSAINR
jgi:hypothetical protein